MFSIVLYHGTSGTFANDIKKSVNYKISDGELGQGFYMGNSLCYACCRAWHRDHSDFKVLSYKFRISTMDDQVDYTEPLASEGISLKCFSSKAMDKFWEETIKQHFTDKKHYSSRYYDVLVSKILDKNSYDSLQFKFEAHKTKNGKVKSPINENNLKDYVWNI